MKYSRRFCALLLCLFVPCVVLAVSSSDTCLQYKFQARAFISLANGPKTLAKYELIANLRPYDNNRHLYTLNIQDPQISIVREKTSSKIKLGDCPSRIAPTTHGLLPSLVVYDTNGLLKYILVDKSESPESISIKFWLAGLLQLNKLNLEPTDVPRKSKKEILLGECPVTYQVKREGDHIGENIRVTKVTDLSECSDVKCRRRPPCDSKLCDTKVDIDGSATSVYQLRGDGSLTVEYALFNSSYTVKPLTPFLKTITANAQLDLTLQKIEKCSHPLVVPSFTNTNATRIDKLPHVAIEKDLMEKMNRMDLFDLTDTYRSLAVAGDYLNIVADMYGKSLNCWKY